MPKGFCCPLMHWPCSGVPSAVGHSPLTSVPAPAEQHFPQDCPCSGIAAAVAALPSAISLLWRGSAFGSTSLRSIPALAWQQLWQHFPQECPHSGVAAVSAALPSGEFPLWWHFPQKGTIPSVQRAPNLTAAVSFNMGHQILLW